MSIFGLLTDGEGGLKRREKVPLPNICNTYPTMMKLGTVTPYLKKIQKIMNHVTHPLRFAYIRIFQISKFCCIKKYRYRLHFGSQFLILLTFLESLKNLLINLVILSLMLAKMTTSGLLKKRYFEIKVMTLQFLSMTSPTRFHHVIQIILQKCSCDQSLVTLAFL